MTIGIGIFIFVMIVGITLLTVVINKCDNELYDSKIDKKKVTKEQNKMRTVNKGDFIIYKIKGKNKEERGQLIKELNYELTIKNLDNNEVVTVHIDDIETMTLDQKEMDKHKNKCSMQQVLGIVGICLGVNLGFLFSMILGYIGLRCGKYDYKDELGCSLCRISILIGWIEFICLIVATVIVASIDLKLLTKAISHLTNAK